LALVLTLGYAVGAQAQDGGAQAPAPLPAGQPYTPSQAESATAQIYQQVVNSVVNVSVAGNNNQFGTGTGFVVDPAGYIVTNNHVAEDASYMEVTFYNGARAEATLVGNDPDSDLAVIKVDPAALNFQLQPVTLADSAAVFVGQNVLAIGSPFGQSFTLTTGIVSALGRQLETVNRFSIPMIIQTDAAINPGNSGGPLLNYAGEVVGVNTAILSGSGTGSGVGFAVPANTVRRIAPYLIQNGQYQHVWLGITGSGITAGMRQAIGLRSDVTGVMVVDVVDGSPAAKAGLQGTEDTTNTAFGPAPIGGDIITAIDGQPVRDMSDLITYLEAETLPGDTVTLSVIRGDAEQQIPVTLEARPAAGS